MIVWALTDPGVVRDHNEDAFFTWTSETGDRALLAVCDGMGGAKAGEVASRLAAEAFEEATAPLRGGLPAGLDTSDLLLRAGDLANVRIFEASRADSSREGMGTTMVSAVWNDDTLTVANVGDSRAYLADDDGLRQITVDHSLVFEMVRRGELRPEEAQFHPHRNVITRALGVEERVTSDLFEVETAPGNMLLLCSDGLTGEVSEPEIYYEIYQSGDPAGACERLIALARARGGHDNITAVLAVI